MSAPTYAQLLEEAQELGRLDGAFAAAFEPSGTTPPTGDRCLGRTPEEFAAMLWADQPGSPPVGLEINGPLWYAAGFAEGLATHRFRPAEPESAPVRAGRPSVRVDPGRRRRRVVHWWAGGTPTD